MPLVTVLMCVYNGEMYLAEAIQSILSQTFTDFELLIVDDGSTDNSTAIIRQFADSRITVLTNEKNAGLIFSLNKGISQCKGKYIARMDADDIALPHRLELQVDFMEKNEEIAICGAGVKEFYHDGRQHHHFYPVTFDDIKAESLFNSPFAHPTVMIRRQFILENALSYSHDFKYAEDYQLWQALIKIGKGENIPAFLLDYRVSQNGQTSTGSHNGEDRFRTISSIHQIALQNIGLVTNEKMLRLHYALSLSDNIRKIDFLEFKTSTILSHLNKITLHVIANGFCNPRSIKKMTGRIWLKVIAFNIRRLPVMKVMSSCLQPLFVYGLIDVISRKRAYAEFKPQVSINKNGVN